MEALAGHIDHTALQPDTTESRIRELCREAETHGFASVCVAPCWVRFAAELLQGTTVAVCTVVGFPLGANLPSTKAQEVEAVIREGAEEIDMVINIGWLKSGMMDDVRDDIRSVVETARAAEQKGHQHIITKVIIETGLLTEDEKVAASVMARDAGADFVKTSTGFNAGGATAQDIALIRRTVGRDMGIKASGGIRTREDAERMIRSGASRIGASGSVAMIEGNTNSRGY